MNSGNGYRMLFADEYLRAFPGAGEAFEVPGTDSRGDTPFHIYGLENAFVLSCGIVLGQGGVTVKECIIRDQHIVSLLDQISGGSKRLDLEYHTLEGEYLSLLGPWNQGFWHWMMEFLPRVVVAEMAGFKGTYIIPPSPAPFIKESLQILGLDSDRTMICENGRNFRVNRLFLPRRIAAGSDPTYLTILRRLRDRLLEGVSAHPHSQGRFYISRKNAGNGRKILNEPELTDLLRDFGFQALFMEEMSLNEQIRTMSGAGWLIGPHGAGMFHSLMMPEFSSVMELFAPTYINPCMTSAMELLGHRYYMITSPHIGDYKYGMDIHAPLDLIRVTLQNALRTPMPGGNMREAQGECLKEKGPGKNNPELIRTVASVAG